MMKASHRYGLLTAAVFLVAFGTTRALHFGLLASVAVVTLVSWPTAWLFRKAVRQAGETPPRWALPALVAVNVLLLATLVVK